MDSCFQPKHPGSFGGIGGVETFRRHVKGRVKTKDIRTWLQNKDAYTLHKPVRLTFRRRITFTVGIDDLWQADLSALSKYNDKNKYLLTCIDVFSKYAWVCPLKSKTGSALTEAFSTMLHDRHPAHLQTDKGTEFLNKSFQALLHENDIRFYTTENDDIKSSVVERFNRTLKTKMWKYFTYKNTHCYMDVLQDLVHSYNNTYHRSIGMPPSQVSIENEDIIRKRLYGEKKRPAIWKYSVGDKVRIAFKKGYLPSWTDEIFTITARIPSDPITYEIADLAEEKIKGKFYEEELQRIIKEDDIYKIEKVLKTRKRGRNTDYFVKSKGYDDSFNSWSSDIFDA